MLHDCTIHHVFEGSPEEQLEKVKWYNAEVTDCCEHLTDPDDEVCGYKVIVWELNENSHYPLPENTAIKLCYKCSVDLEKELKDQEAD